MHESFITKTFKSGNSVAIRLPKGLGVEPGTVMELVRDDQGRIFARPAVEERQSLSDLFGSFSSGFMADGRGEVEQDVRDWQPNPKAA